MPTPCFLSTKRYDVKNMKSEEFAIIETGGKQYKVAVGDVVTIEKLPVSVFVDTKVLMDKKSTEGKVEEPKKGSKITFDKVLLVDNGKDTTIGMPYIAGAKVDATLVGEGRAKKIDVIKYKAKSRYFKKRGHRQPFMKVKIESLK